MTAAISQADPAPVVSNATGRSRGLMLVGLGGAGLAGPGGLPELEPAARQLAELLGLPLRSLTTLEDPSRALCTLDPSAASGGWLAALPLDLGRSLADGSCWADHLGAWAQPCLLVITAAQLESGLPRAGAALLRQQQVPLVGLLQQGGLWDGAARRTEGLPWLGQLPETEAMNEMLAVALLGRWASLQSPRS